MSVTLTSRVALLLSLLPLTISAQTAEELFNSQSLHEIRLTMLPSDWQLLHDNYMQDTFYPCAFSWNGYELPKIGIRSRGSQSRSPIKPSIGLDFSKYSSTQRFAGLKTVVLRNLNQDASMMHEFLSEALYARLGLPHSREAYTRLFVNGEYAGVYLLVEPIDARFVKVHLGEESGYLYDMQNLDFPYRFEYLGSDLARYIPGLFDPKTNTADPDAAGVMEMIRVVNETHDNDFFEAVDQIIDLHAVVTHAAAETALSNWDGVLGINGMRNFYLYRWSGNRRAMFLTWDMDGTFFDPEWPLFEHAGRNVLTRRALQVPALRQRYIEALDAAAHAIADDNWLHREITRVYNQLQAAVYADSYKLCRTNEGIGRCTNEMFEEEVFRLYQFASARPSFIWHTLSAEPLHDSAAPDLRPGAAVTMASELPAFAPGSLATLRTPLSVSGPFHAAGFPLPEELAGVRLETAAGPAALIEVCPEGITFIVPESLRCGPQLMRVMQNAHPSNTITIELRPTAPVVFAATHAAGDVISAQSPAAGSEWIVLYATGVWTGAKPEIKVNIDGAPATVHWAGATPGFAGMQQLVIELPPLAAGPATAKLCILIDGETGPPFLLPVRR